MLQCWFNLSRLSDGKITELMYQGRSLIASKGVMLALQILTGLVFKLS